MLDEERVRNTNQTLEDSMNTRREAELNLTTCCSKGDLEKELEKKVQGLSVVGLNRQVCPNKQVILVGSDQHSDASSFSLLQICGGSGLNCSDCGGALCFLSQGQRKCGGPNCDGLLPFSQNVSDRAQRAKEDLQTLPSRLEESKNKVGHLRLTAP